LDTQLEQRNWFLDNSTTWDEVRDETDSDLWIVENVISSNTTLLYGVANCGKSFLASALVNALVSGSDFLGKPVPQDRSFSVAVCHSDDAGNNEYKRRIQTVYQGSTAPPVQFYAMKIMRAGDWHALFEAVMANGQNFVLIDNLTQVLDGSINEDRAVREFFDGVRMFVRAGIPVVIVGHSSDKTGESGRVSDKPMGSATISQSVRWQAYAKRSRQGNITLTFSGNHAQPHQMIVRHGAGARFEVIDSKSAEELDKAAENRAKRTSEAMDMNARIAAEIKRQWPNESTSKQAEYAAELDWVPLGKGTIRNRIMKEVIKVK
jgi:hypothetical protein